MTRVRRVITILAFILLGICYASSESKTVLTLCKYPIEGQTCTLRCEPRNYLITLFLHHPVTGSGIGRCYRNLCEAKGDNYKAFRNATATYLKIGHLNRTKDQQKWVCENDRKISAVKHLIVYTLLKTVNLEPTPSKVIDTLELTAEGYCVYPANVTAELLHNVYQNGLKPNIHYDNPVFKYLRDDDCEADEYKVVVKYNIKVSGYAGDMTFRVKLTQIGIGKSQTSHESKIVTFAASGPPSTSFTIDQTEFPSWGIALVVILPLLLLLAAFFCVRFKLWKMIKNITACLICCCRCSH